MVRPVWQWAPCPPVFPEAEGPPEHLDDTLREDLRISLRPSQEDVPIQDRSKQQGEAQIHVEVARQLAFPDALPDEMLQFAARRLHHHIPPRVAKLYVAR